MTFEFANIHQFFLAWRKILKLVFNRIYCSMSVIKDSFLISITIKDQTAPWQLFIPYLLPSAYIFDLQWFLQIISFQSNLL